MVCLLRGIQYRSQFPTPSIKIHVDKTGLLSRWTTKQYMYLFRLFLQNIGCWHIFRLISFNVVILIWHYLIFLIYNNNLIFIWEYKKVLYFCFRVIFESFKHVFTGKDEEFRISHGFHVSSSPFKKVHMNYQHAFI